MDGTTAEWMFGTADGVYNLSDMPAYLHVGEYTVYYRITADNHTTVTGLFTVVITKAGNEWSPEYARDGWTYAGGISDETAPGAKFGDAVVKYYTDAGYTKEYSDAFDSRTPAGTYYVVVTVEGTGDYDGLRGEYQFIVAKAKLPATVDIEGRVYKQAANEPEILNNYESGSIVIRYKGRTNGGADYDETTAPTQAGEYRVEVTVGETANYEGGVITCDFTVARANYTPNITIEGWRYTGTAYAPVVTGLPDDAEFVLSYLYNGRTNALTNNSYSSADAPTQAGKYTVTVTIAETDNYNSATATSAEFEVYRIASEIKLNELEGLELTYNGQKQVINSGATLNHSEMPLVYSNNEFTDVPVGGILRIRVGVEQSPNYESAYVETDIIIHKANVVFDTSGVGEYTYTGKEQTVDSGITIVFGAGELVYTNNKFTDVPEGGILRMTVTVAESTNFNAAEFTVDVTVHKAYVNAPAIPSEFYTGDLLKAAVSDSEYWTVTKNEGGIATGSYDVVLTLRYPNNYQWQTAEGVEIDGADATLQFIITAVENLWTTAPSIEDIIYGETLEWTAEAKYGNDTLSVTFSKDNGESVTGTPKDAGKYVAHFYVAGTGEYSTLRQDVAFEIGRKELSLPELNIAGREYDGTTDVTGQVTLGALAGILNGDDVYVSDGWTAHIADKNAGTGKAITLSVTLGGAAADNYVLVQPEITIDIAPRAITVTIEAVGSVYGEEPAQPQHSVTSGEIVAGDENVYSVRYDVTKETRTGSYDAITEALDGNYAVTFVGAERSYTVRNATITGVTVEGYNGVYDKEEHSLVVSKSASIVNGLDAVWEYSISINGKDFSEWSTEVPVRTDANTYIVKYRITAANHGVYEDQFNAVISKADTIINTDGVVKELTYNGSLQIIDSGATINHGEKLPVYRNNSFTDVPEGGVLELEIYVESSTNYNEARVTVRITVNKKGVKLPAIESLAYTGELQIPTIPTSDRWTVYENNGGTNKGQYPVKLQLTDADNYAWIADAGAEIDGDIATIYFSIAGAKNEWTVAPSAENSVYGDLLSWFAEAKYGNDTLQIEYRVNGGQVLTDAPVNAGVYEVRFSVAMTDDYTGLASDWLEFTITPKEVEIEWTGPSSEFTYNGADQKNAALAEITAKFTDIAGVEQTLTVILNEEFKNAGEYFFAVELADGNYKFSNPTLAVVMQAKALDDSMTGEITGDYTYSGTGFEPDVRVIDGETELIRDTDFTVTYADNVDAGTATVTITGKGNYAGTLTRTFTIARAKVDKPTEDTNDYTYTGNEQTYSPNGFDESTMTITGNVQTDADSYTVTVSLKANYCWTDGSTDDVTFTFTIALAPVDKPTADTNDYMYTGNELTYRPNGFDESTMTIAGNVQTAADSYTVTVSLKDKDNYCWADETSEDVIFMFVIEKKTFDTGVIVFDDLTVVEDGTEKNLAYTGTLPEGIAVEYVNNGQTAPGVYTVTLKFIVSSNYNAIADKTATLTILSKKLNSGNGVEIECESGLHPDYVLDVKDTTADHGSTILGDGMTVGQAWDITLKHNGQSVQFSGKLSIRLLIDEQYRGRDDLKVYYIADDGTITEVEAVRDGDYMVIATEHLSTYVIGVPEAGSSDVGKIIGLCVGAAAVAGLCVWLIVLRRRRRKAA